MVRKSQVAEKSEGDAMDLKTSASVVEQMVDSVGLKNNKRQFKSPETDKNIDNMSRKQFALKTKSKMKWVVNLYSEWRKSRIGLVGCAPQILNANLDTFVFSKYDLCYSMARFIREVRKLDGSEYPLNTVRDLVLMIQMHLHENNIFWKLLDNVEFVELRNVLDNTMKERHSQGLGVRKSSDIITIDHENKLFNKGLLGDENPEQLLRTVIYMIGLHCVLRGGNEHNNLRRPGFDSQFSFEHDTRGIEQLVYHEDPLQKTNQGGLSSKGKSKIVYVYPSSSTRNCPVYLVKKYLGLLPQSKKCKKLYLRCR